MTTAPTTSPLIRVKTVRRPPSLVRDTVLWQAVIGALGFAGWRTWHNREDFLKLLPESWAFVIRTALAPQHQCADPNCKHVYAPFGLTDDGRLVGWEELDRRDPVSALSPENVASLPPQ